MPIATHAPRATSKPEAAMPPGERMPFGLLPGEHSDASGRLAGMTALITGITGADGGIGRAVALLFAREGADVAVAVHSVTDDARSTQRQVEAEGRRCLLLQGDLSDGAWCRTAVQNTLDTFGRLDVLVNNAAFQERGAAIGDTAPTAGAAEAADMPDSVDQRLHDALDAHIGGQLHMARAAVPHLLPGAAIIHTGRVSGLRGGVRPPEGGASQGGIHALTKALAANLADRGIRVSAVAPVWTPLDAADRSAAATGRFGQDTEIVGPAQPEELAPAFVFLASPACSGHLTGIVLPVIGSAGAR